MEADIWWRIPIAQSYYKKNLQGHARQLFLYSSRRNRGVENIFFALFYIQKDLSTAKSFCGLRHCREQALPAQWKAEELCQEATAISGCHWWVGWPSGHREPLPSAPGGIQGKVLFPGLQRDKGRGIPLGHCTRWATGPLVLCWNHAQLSFS